MSSFAVTLLNNDAKRVSTFSSYRSFLLGDTHKPCSRFTSTADPYIYYFHLDCLRDWFKLGNDGHHVSYDKGLFKFEIGSFAHFIFPKCCRNRFPLTIVPAYTASLGYAKQDEIMYGVIASILAGSVAGDHASPISDTTILSAMASGCDVLQHVKTQGPYAVMVALWSILAGTLPNGRGVPNWACIVIGFAAMIFHSVFTSAFVINKTGRFDIFTELFLRCKKDTSFYDSLRADTVKCFETGHPVPLPESMAELLETKRIDDNDDEEGDTTIRTKKIDDDEGPEAKIGLKTEHTDSFFDDQAAEEDVVEAAADAGGGGETSEGMMASKSSKSSLIDSGAIFASFMKHLAEDHALSNSN